VNAFLFGRALLASSCSALSAADAAQPLGDSPKEIDGLRRNTGQLLKQAIEKAKRRHAEKARKE